VGVIVTLLYCCFSYSVKDVRNENEFYKKIQHAPFTVALFYKDNKQNRTWHTNMMLQRRNFKVLSSEGFYRNGDVQFIEADIERKYLLSVKNDFGVTSVPALALFNYGKLVRTQDNKPALLADKKFPFLKPDAMKNLLILICVKISKITSSKTLSAKWKIVFCVITVVTSRMELVFRAGLIMAHTMWLRRILW